MKRDYLNTPCPPAISTIHYERSRAWSYGGNGSAALRRSIVTPDFMSVVVNNRFYYISSAQTLDLNAAATWDTTSGTDYTTAANRIGKDFYVYACQPSSGSSPVLLVSASTTYPSGYTADTSRKIAGFHCMPGDCTSLPAGHPYINFIAGDVIFNSIWDILDRPLSSPEGMVKISLTPSDGYPALWVDIYLASGVGDVCTSVFGATIKDTVSWDSFVDYGRLQGKRLLYDGEFQNAAFGGNEQTNIAGSADPGTVTFPLDTTGRSMISYYGVIGACGIMYQWLADQCYRYDADGGVVAASKTLTAYHAASPGGNPVYVKFLATGEPYLCANMATDAADKWLTFGTDYKILIKHDADAATGSSQIYFDEDATQPGRILANLARGKDAYVPSNNPTFSLKITHNANAATTGVAISFDDGSDERLEFVSPTSANGTLDLASTAAPTWAYHNMSSKGSRYGQGTYGDAKLRAGGYWAAGSDCGSRCRNLNGGPWAASSNVGGRFGAEPL